MRKMKFTSWGMACLLGGCLSLVSCQQEELGGVPVAKGTGTITLELNAQPGFASSSKTKAVDEAAYTKVGDYTVEIRKDDESGSIVKSGLAKELTASSSELGRGSYFLKAYMGEEKVSSRDVFYSVGSDYVSVLDENEKKVSLTCEPTCAKFVVNFDENMKTYFSDYYVIYSTAALGNNTVTWAKNDTAPWYLKVGKDETVKATFHVTRLTDGKSNSGEWSYVISPNKAWTLNVKANNNLSEGNLGLTITVDDGTENIPVEITVPSDWAKD